MPILLSPFNPMASKNVRLTVIAENMLIKIPTPKVRAKPLIMLVPIQNRIPAVIKLDMLESLMESHARLKPSETADCKFFPFFNSSFILSNIKMLASTAMPTDRINQAMPAAVKVTGMSLNKARIIMV